MDSAAPETLPETESAALPRVSPAFLIASLALAASPMESLTLAAAASNCCLMALCDLEASPSIESNFRLASLRASESSSLAASSRNFLSESWKY